MLATTETEVVCLKTKDCSEGMLHGDVVNKHIANIAATVTIGLEIDGVFHGTYLYVVHEDVLYPTRHLTTDTETVALGIEKAVANDDVL